jgi:hypothetical protein
MPRAAIVLLVVLVAGVRGAWAGDGARAPAHLRLATTQLLRLLESRTPLPPAESDPLRGFLERLRTRPVGLRPLFTLLPAEPQLGGESMLPTFALVARAEGRTFVSLTRPDAKVDPGDRVILHRLLVSDLLEGRRFSLTVYEDHALDRDAARFLGVGARLSFRPAVSVGGWRLRVELFGSYDVDHGGTAYLALTGRLGAPPLVTVPAGGGAGTLGPDGVAALAAGEASVLSPAASSAAGPGE